MPTLCPSKKHLQKPCKPVAEFLKAPQSQLEASLQEEVRGLLISTSAHLAFSKVACRHSLQTDCGRQAFSAVELAQDDGPHCLDMCSYARKTDPSQAHFICCLGAAFLMLIVLLRCPMHAQGFQAARRLPCISSSHAEHAVSCP